MRTLTALLTIIIGLAVTAPATAEPPRTPAYRLGYSIGTLTSTGSGLALAEAIAAAAKLQTRP